MDADRLDAAQLDGLREVANIGAGHAATALSNLTGRRVSLSVPQIRVLRLEEIGEALGDPEQIVAAVMMRLVGELTGRTVHIFDAHAAATLAAMLLGRDARASPAEFDAAERSALEEVSSIIAGSYLNALSAFTGVDARMSVPELAVDMMAAVLSTSYVNFEDVNDHVFYMSTRLGVVGTEEELRARFLFLPDPASLGFLLRGLRLG